LQEQEVVVLVHLLLKQMRVLLVQVVVELVEQDVVQVYL
jgi:hypothetical protein